MSQLQSKLLRELTPLRKGNGITPLRLSYTMNIRAIAAHTAAVPQDRLTDSQAYNFLLSKIAALPDDLTTAALRNALGIGSSLQTLSARRASLATATNRHPDTIERYENEGLSRLAADLAEHSLSMQDEHAPTNLSRHYLQELEARADATRTMTTIGLASHLSLPSHSEDLIRYLEVPRKPYIDASVHIWLLPSSRGEEWYRFRLSYLFQGGREGFRVAVVLNSADGEQLMANGLVDDYHRLDNPDNPDRDIKTIIANSKFIIRNQSANTQKLLRLREVPPSEADQILGSTSQPLAETCWLLQITIPAQWQTADYTCEYLSWITLQIASVAYWYAPTLMYLKKLTLDFSQFPGAKDREFYLLPFLGHMPGTEQTEKHLYILNLNNWIMPGHGVVLGWQAPSDTEPHKHL